MRLESWARFARTISRRLRRPFTHLQDWREGSTAPALWYGFLFGKLHRRLKGKVILKAWMSGYGVRMLFKKPKVLLDVICHFYARKFSLLPVARELYREIMVRWLVRLKSLKSRDVFFSTRVASSEVVSGILEFSLQVRVAQDLGMIILLRLVGR